MLLFDVMLNRRRFLQALPIGGAFAGACRAPTGNASRIDRLASNIEQVVDRFGRADMGAVTILYKGASVFERDYARGDARAAYDVRSAGKSFTSILVGCALHEGAVASLDATLPQMMPEFAHRAAQDARVGRITLRHLLAMRSGFDADENRPESIGYEDTWNAEQDWLRYFVNVPMRSEPGSEFAYASMNTALLGMIVARAMRRSLANVFEERLAGPLGFAGHHWARAPHGDVVPQGNLFLRVTDFHKLGHLVLNQGRWSERQLVPREWIALATSQITDLQTPPYSGYGLHWWRGEALKNGVRLSFPFASGNGGQKCFVIAELDLVCTTTSTAFGQRRGHERAHAILDVALDEFAAA